MGRTKCAGTLVVDTSHSHYAKVCPAPIEAVRLVDRFWSPRIRSLQGVTLPAQFTLLEETGRTFNFRRASGRKEGPFRGLFFNDSDVYKWVEATAFSLAVTPDEKLHELIEQTVGDISAAQDEDGYLNTFFMFEQKGERWKNLREMHELYCAGHLIQAAIAHHRATGSKRFLEVAIRLADHISKVFGPGKRDGTPGHPEIEMALVELFRETNDRTYLNLATFFIDNRGKGIVGGSATLIDHKPFRELTDIVGHAVRSIYLNCGAADLFMETGEGALWDTLERLWKSMIEKRMYVTGGVGARYDGEAFGVDYELPNERAYAETCASIANIMWAFRMFLISGEGRFLDLLELALYNGALSGISLDGEQFFYVNPLADRGRHRRRNWFDCACCPPNIARTLASVPGYFYALSDDGIWINLYGQSVSHLATGDNLITIEQNTEYPWQGEVELVVRPEKDIQLCLHLRIPGWCRDPKVSLNGRSVEANPRPSEFLVLDRVWRAGDRVHLSMPMPAERIVCNPHVFENVGRVALRRGPLIYCVEQVDNPGYDVWELALPMNARLEVERIPDLLNDIVLIRGMGLSLDCKWSGNSLYDHVGNEWLAARPVRFTAIPYYAWSNRTAGPMTVWIRAIAGI